MSDALVLAVDAGGTNCRAVLGRQDGKILAYGEAGSCNYHSIGTSKVKRVLTKLLLQLSTGRPRQVACAFFGLAGIDTPRDYEVLVPIVREALKAAKFTANELTIDNDAMLTLEGAVGRNNGILLIAGTGSIACGVRKDGKRSRAGGWGYRIGDEGSGFYIGRAALCQVLCAMDGRAPASAITAAVLAKMKLNSEFELVSWLYGPQFSVAEVAGLTPLILQLAEQGDNEATKIAKTAADELVRLAIAVVTQLDLAVEPFEVLFGGSLWNSSFLTKSVQGALIQRYTKAKVTICQEMPLALILYAGFQKIGITDEKLFRQAAQQLADLSARKNYCP